MLALIKGLPSSYQRDLQEDKAPVWRALRTSLTTLDAVAVALGGITFQRERMREALTDDTLATELADVLVDRGVAFRDAHHAVGQVVAAARARGVSLLKLAEQEAALPESVRREDITALSYEAAIERRQADGGTGRDALIRQIDSAERQMQS